MDDRSRALVEKTIRRNFSGAPKALDPSLDLREDIKGFDLDVIQTVMDLEDAFEIEITEDEDAAIKTVGDVFALIERKLAAGVSA